MSVAKSFAHCEGRVLTFNKRWGRELIDSEWWIRRMMNFPLFARFFKFSNLADFHQTLAWSSSKVYFTLSFSLLLSFLGTISRDLAFLEMLGSWHPEKRSSVLAVHKCLVTHWAIIYSSWTVFYSELTTCVLLLLLLNNSLHPAFFTRELSTLANHRWIAPDQVRWCNCSHIAFFANFWRTELVRVPWFVFIVTVCRQSLLFKLCLLEFFMLSEIELGTGETLMEDRHDWDKHLRRDVWVEIDIFGLVELAECSKCTIKKCLDIFFLLFSLNVVHSFSLWCHVHALLLLV